MMKWKIANAMKAELDPYLDNGWEPYAVTMVSGDFGFDTPLYHLRKQVEEPQQSLPSCKEKDNG